MAVAAPARRNGTAKAPRTPVRPVEIPPPPLVDVEAAEAQFTGDQQIVIPRPNLRLVTFRVVGIMPLITHRFSEKARAGLLKTQQAEGATKAKRENRDPKADFEAAKYVNADKTDPFEGMAASAFRAAAIEATRFVEAATKVESKMSLFVLADGRSSDGTPIVRVDGKSRMREDTVRIGGMNKTTDLRFRPEYVNWKIKLRCQYNANVLSLQSVVNLFAHAGLYVGVGEWRPSSPKSLSGEFGRFNIDRAFQPVDEPVRFGDEDE